MYTISANIVWMFFWHHKSKLQKEFDRASKIDQSLYTAKSAKALEEALQNASDLLKRADLSEDDQDIVDRGAKAIGSAVDGLVRIDRDNDDHETSNSGSNSHKGSSSNGKTSGEGTAVAVTTPAVITGAASVAKTASVISDTTVNFTMKRGSAYCFKMTVVNGSIATPSFTVGNCDVLKTQFVAKIGNEYYFRVYAVGALGSSTGVYTTMPGEAAQQHCVVTIN